MQITKLKNRGYIKMGKRVGKKRLTQNTQSDRNRIYERMFNSAGIISNRSCLFEIKIRELKLLMTDIESAWESMRKAKDELEMCNVDFRYLDRNFRYYWGIWI